MIGTAHLRDFGDGEKWYFLPALTCDFFIGVFIPNDACIKSDSYIVESIENNINLDNNCVCHARLVGYCDKYKAIIERIADEDEY